MVLKYRRMQGGSDYLSIPSYIQITHPNFRRIELAVVGLDITKQSPFADGETFGDVGSYELLEGTVHFSVDPELVWTPKMPVTVPLTTWISPLVTLQGRCGSPQISQYFNRLNSSAATIVSFSTWSTVAARLPLA